MLIGHVYISVIIIVEQICVGQECECINSNANAARSSWVLHPFFALSDCEYIYNAARTLLRVWVRPFDREWPSVFYLCATCFNWVKIHLVKFMVCVMMMLTYRIHFRFGRDELIYIYLLTVHYNDLWLYHHINQFPCRNKIHLNRRHKIQKTERVWANSDECSTILTAFN